LSSWSIGLHACSSNDVKRVGRHASGNAATHNSNRQCSGLLLLS
jgi:hypothetical protein